MATKREDIAALVEKTMETREITSTPGQFPALLETFKPPRKEQIQIRFDPGDYAILQRIAYRKGTKAAALVRQVVKEYIQKKEDHESYR